MQAKIRPDSGVERVSDRHLPRISRESRSHLARHIGVPDAGVGIGKAECTAGSRSPKRTCASEPPDATWLEEAERELNVASEEVVVEDSRHRRNRWGSQEIQRRRAQAQFTPAVRKDAVRAGDAPRGADGAA